jgi:hypothetical protein
MKTGADTHGTAEDESESTKREKGTRRPRYPQKHVRERTPSVTPKMSQGAQNLKTRPDALGTAENEFGRAKYENGTRRTR